MQGLGIVTGQQHGFSWRSVAASGIASGVSYGIQNSNAYRRATHSLSLTTQGVLSGASQSFVREGAGVLVKERGRISWNNVTIGGINGVIQGYGEQRRASALLAARAQEDTGAITYPLPDELTFVGEHMAFNPALASNPGSLFPSFNGVAFSVLFLIGM